jgi:Fic family protein
MLDLFEYIKSAGIPWILKACIFHYELEFIHPFQDGNGRMGRLWQQLLLMKDDAMFQYIPVEVLIKEHQGDYYRVLGESDEAGDCTLFIEFSLELILKALAEFSHTTSKIPQNPTSRLSFAQDRFHKEWFNRKDYMNVHQDISTSTASRDLSFGLKKHVLSSKGENNQMFYQFMKED